MKTPPVISLMGPTAAGKTALSIDLAKRLNAEIISVDSALIFQDMDIGTAKPDENERQGIRHWLIDIRTPEEPYSVAEFIEDVNVAIHDIHNRDKPVILVGGTMLYFNALINGISQIPATDPKVRETVKAQIDEIGIQAIHNKLKEIDPIVANRVHQNDTQRTTRAYEVYLATGKPLSYWQSLKQPATPYAIYQFGLVPQDRTILHENIAERFDQMLARGLVQEVEKLLDTYHLNPELPSMRSVGYRQVYELLHSKINFSEMRERGIAATRQLAKRQLTWLRGWPDMVELNPNERNNVCKVIEKTCAP